MNNANQELEPDYLSAQHIFQRETERCFRTMMQFQRILGVDTEFIKFPRLIFGRSWLITVD